MKQTAWALPRLFLLFLTLFTLAACSQQNVKSDKKKKKARITTTTSVGTGPTGSSFSGTEFQGIVDSTDAATISPDDFGGEGVGDLGTNAQITALNPDTQAAVNELLDGDGKGRYTPADLNNPKTKLTQRIIYFDYNQSSILPQYKEVLAAHAQLLKNNPEIRVRVEGHADERGSPEYNIALSENRAKTVRQYLAFKNVATDQMETIGYGEEKPLVRKHDEKAWNKNRRVELNYVTY
ncbi:MAG: peptidoglycan-associated lipoprotein Pal [Cocleimonas sp.]|nr:peptidoglycan-associated lipoprotein Pal [Cocleimonas sp.]